MVRRIFEAEASCRQYLPAYPFAPLKMSRGVLEE